MRGRVRRAVLPSVTAALALVAAGCDGRSVATPPDGIAYVGPHEDVHGVYVVTPDGRTRVRLTDEPAIIHGIAWSPDGTRIAFAADRPEDGIYVMDADGSGKRRVSHDEDEESSFVNPAWSPDGTRIVYTEGLGGENDVYVVDVDGHGLTRLASPGEGGAWSPDGSHIAFAAQGKIYVAGAAGGSRRRLAVGGEPSWSPDDRRVAFERCETDESGTFDCDISVINADGSGERTLVAGPALDMEPVWSPDGSRLAFERETGGGTEAREIWVTTADGSQTFRVARQSCDPAWSPDATQLAFYRSCDIFGGIWIANADGKEAMQIADEGLAPAWRPPQRP